MEREVVSDPKTLSGPLFAGHEDLLRDLHYIRGSAPPRKKKRPNDSSENDGRSTGGAAAAATTDVDAILNQQLGMGLGTTFKEAHKLSTDIGVRVMASNPRLALMRGLRTKTASDSMFETSVTIPRQMSNPHLTRLAQLIKSAYESQANPRSRAGNVKKMDGRSAETTRKIRATVIDTFNAKLSELSGFTGPGIEAAIDATAESFSTTETVNKLVGVEAEPVTPVDIVRWCILERPSQETITDIVKTALWGVVLDDMVTNSHECQTRYNTKSGARTTKIVTDTHRILDALKLVKGLVGGDSAVKNLKS